MLGWVWAGRNDGCGSKTDAICKRGDHVFAGGAREMSCYWGYDIIKDQMLKRLISEHRQLLFHLD